MQIVKKTIECRGTADTDLIDITDEVVAIVRESGTSAGIVNVFVPGSTASVTTIEYESGALADLERAIERMAPRDMHYDHDARWGDGNGYSHVRAALLGPNVAIPIDQGQPLLGTWQQILLCDFDNRPRSRQVIVQVVGD
ncbi:MAG: secondary thiamine-phosphate synthase enzyme YjbQ [Proteobacteria bacterium]|nr:secondary thiamine-phosphate synthase enzyme YjbQ [Pseudomonadota bacterium]